MLPAHLVIPSGVRIHYLTLASIHDALSCSYDNREEIDKEIAEFEALDPGLHNN